MKTVPTHYDVAVIGGGIAGCAAALQAARLGRKTVLVEKTLFPGGLATAGLIYLYLPLCDGMGRQVSFGITRELLTAGHKYGPGELPSGWQSPEPKTMNERLLTTFSPASLVLALDELLEEAGVDIWLDTVFCRAETTDGDRVCAVELENKSGRLRLEASCFVDATGDADVARSTGAPCDSGTNTLSQWVIQYDRPARCNSRNLADSLSRHVLFDRDQREHDPERYRGISGWSVSDFALAARRRLREFYLESYAGGRTRNDLFPLLLPAVANFRTTYFIRGGLRLSPEIADLHFPDSVGLFGNWKNPGPILELPFRCLVPQKIRGLLAAGRCISVAGETCELTRVIPVAALTGQVCGAAAALALTHGCLPEELPYELLARHLREEGFFLHRDELP